MPAPAPEAFALGGRYALDLARAPMRGPAGQHLGRGTGASLELHERRAYVVGDDVRHLDWSAFARTDQLMVRVYREEVLPRVEILVDGSRSMAVDPAKASLTVDLVALLLEAAHTAGSRASLFRLDERLEPEPEPRFRESGLSFDGVEPFGPALAGSGGAGRLRAGATRVLISDFLFPHEPAALVRPLAAQAGSFLLLRVLGREDRAADVEPGTAVRMIDSETGEELELVLDAAAIDAYRARLRRLGDALSDEARRLGGRLLELTAEADLASTCRDTLLPAGLLVPR